MPPPHDDHTLDQPVGDDPDYPSDPDFQTRADARTMNLPADVASGRARGSVRQTGQHARPASTARRPRRPDPLLGQVLGGCKIERKLGKGGMATVYLGRQLDLDREVAVKVLSPKLTRDEAQVEQFMREARTLARLEHPNIVTVYSVGAHEEVRFLVLQLVREGSVHDMLRERKKLPVPEAVELVKQVARGLGEAHSQGIAHRDIKPDNILRKGSTFMVTDFGLALMKDDPTQAGTQRRVVGTPHYISPEQVDAQHVDSRTDIYGLGATFYHLLVGQPPFLADSLMNLLVAHVTEPLIPPVERNPNVPAPINQVVCRMLEKDPADRYQSMAEVIAALERPQAAPEPPPKPPKEPERVPELLLQEEGELAPLAASLEPMQARLPSAFRYAAVAVAALGLAVLGGLRTVMADADSGELWTSPAVEAANADLEAFRREAAQLEEAEALAGWEALAEEHPGTAAGKTAADRAKTIAEKLAVAAQAAREARLEAALARREQRELGPALDALEKLGGELGPDDPLSAQVTEAVQDIRTELTRLGLAWIPAGPFPAGEGRRADSALFVNGVYLGLREVTCAEYAAFVAAGRGEAPASWGGNSPPAGSEELPVTGIPPAAAQAYAAWRGMRLPSANEWEKAARGPEGRRWPWGDGAEPGNCNWGRDDAAQLAPGGSFPADVSPYGCLDMAGNAAEFVRAPGSKQVWIRGGSWQTRRLANTRAAYYLDKVPADLTHPAVGFRCASDALPGGGQ